MGDRLGIPRVVGFFAFFISLFFFFFLRFCEQAINEFFFCQPCKNSLRVTEEANKPFRLQKPCFKAQRQAHLYKVRSEATYMSC